MGTDTQTRSFTGGAVVQLVAGEPERGDAVVVAVHPARIDVGPDRIVAAAEDGEWSWLLRDLQRVSHGADEPWSIFEVPGVDDHGVAVEPDDVAAFRAAIDSAVVASGSPAAVVDLRPAPPAAPALLPPPPAPLESSAAALLATLPPPDPTAIIAPSPFAPPPPAVEVDAPAKVDLAGELTGLEARGISAWFGTHHVLDRVSLDMAPGEVTALIGPSGCGKSTFLRILNRMHEMIPSASLAGEVLLAGEDIYSPERRLTEARRQIGMVFQKPNPFPAMSIYDNVCASFKLTGTKVSSDDKDEVVESCLSKAGLWNEVKDRLRSPGGGLSGGQQQRLCIARALAIKPKVLLMDEPCSALDPTSTRRIEQTIVELVDEVTIVIVTHNMQQASRVSNRCAFFLAEAGTPGVIVEHGPTDAMFSDPQDQRTSDYVNGRFG